MRVDNKTSKPKNLTTGHKKGVRVVPVTLPPVKKAKGKPLMDDSELNHPIVYGKVKQDNKVVAGKKVHNPTEDDLEDALGKTGPTPEQLGALSTKVAKAVDLQAKIDSLGEMLKAHNEELHLLTTRELPDMLAQAGTTLYKTDAGVKVEIKEFMNGSIPKDPDARAAALAWLEKNGAKDLIKVAFGVALGRGQKQDALQVRKALKSLGVTYSEKEDVNAQSLYAFARERVKAGEPLPLDTLGLYAGRVAKITMPA